MEKLLKPKDIAERYGCSDATARNYIRRIASHMENPLRVTASAFREWEESRIAHPVNRKKKAKAETLKRDERGIVIVPRTR